MVNNNPNQRVGVFIDVQNIYHSAKNLYRSRVNFKELMKAVVGRRQLVRSMAYVIKTENTEGESSFSRPCAKPEWN